MITTNQDVQFFEIGPNPRWFPDWLWRRACKIIERGLNATQKRDGQLIQRTVRCVKRLDKVVTDRGVRAVIKEYSDVFFALKLIREDSLRVWEVKARTLAGQTDRAIARAVGLTKPIAATFLDLFFDIRGKLTAGSWIRWQVLGMRHDQPPCIETLALWHCWRKGISMVEPWRDFLQHVGEHHDLESEIGRQRAAIQLLVDVHQLPNTPENRHAFFKKFAFIAQKLPGIPTSVSVAGVFSRIEVQILGDIAWQESEDELIYDDKDWDLSLESECDLEFSNFALVG